MKIRSLIPAALLLAFGSAGAANALTITEEPGSNLASFAYTVDYATRTIDLFEGWGANTDTVVLRFDDWGYNLLSWTVNKFIVNETGDDWTAFSLELLESDKSGSNDDDGLSFAQYGVPIRPRSSDSFAVVTADEVWSRDYLNFTDGEVLNGHSAFFTFGLTARRNTEDTNPFFLRQIAAEIGVPEPATWALLITGFGLVGVSLRRRRPALSSVSA